MEVQDQEDGKFFLKEVQDQEDRKKFLSPGPLAMAVTFQLCFKTFNLFSKPLPYYTIARAQCHISENANPLAPQ